MYGTLTFDQKKMETMFKSKPESVRAFLAIILAISNTNITIDSFDFVNTQPLDLMLLLQMDLRIQLAVYLQLKMAINIVFHRGILKGSQLR